MDKDIFRQEVYDIVAAIPPGCVLTYGQIAYLIGKPQYSRMVGHAMHNAPSELH
ncbi:MGMT family protein, partial [Bacteroides sp. KG68]